MYSVPRATGWSGWSPQWVSDRVMAQVEIQCGPHRVVSLISSEAVKDLDLEPGMLAVAVIKSSNVMIEAPAGSS